MSIIDVVYRVAHDYPGGIRALAARMNKNPHVLQNKVNPNCETHHLTVEEAAQIADLTDTDDIARAFAERRNMVCVRLAQFDGVSDMELLDLFLELETQKGEWVAAIKKALSDGMLDAVEFERISKEFNEFCAAGAEVESRLKSMVQERKVGRGK
jgi:hypothetical protein